MNNAPFYRRTFSLTATVSDNRPYLSKLLERLVAPFFRLFDRFYGSRYSPLYRSGALVAALFVILLVTGLYLVFFYSVSQPYESLSRIQSDLWFGRWVRAVHRYATDAALVALAFHILQILVHGKTWGPRLLAWISGIVLLAALLVSAWTGYVMVWDRHGQLLALGGASMLQVLPFLRDVLATAFDGSTKVDQGFFFMNLFLHVGVPLLMVFGLWAHTARLARADWFPARSTFLWLTIAIVLLGMWWPAPLSAPADLLSLPGEVPLDWLYAFWLPVVEKVSPKAGILIMVVTVAFLTSIPWWWRLRRRPEPSNVDPNTCTGCTQCAHDCPYEAISMLPHPAGKRLFAHVEPSLCVSCGICAASCDDRAIGPPGRTAAEQVAQAELFVRSCGEVAPGTVVAITCEHNGAFANALSAQCADIPQVRLYPVDCCGTVHSDTLEALLMAFPGICILGCAEGNCRNRDGLSLIRQRIYEKRVPFLARSIDRDRVALASFSDAEVSRARETIESLVGRLGSGAEDSSYTWGRRVGMLTRRAMATTVLLLPIAYLSQAPYGADLDHALLRIAIKIPGRAVENCRPLSDEEKETLPKHMQPPRICETVFVDYTLRVTLDGATVAEELFTHRGVQGDAPLLINKDIVVQPGEHDLSARLTPRDQKRPSSLVASITFSGQSHFLAGKIQLLGLDDKRETLILRN